MRVDGLYIGIMSGTSADAADAALVRIKDGKCDFIAAASCQYESQLRQSLLRLNADPALTLPKFIELDYQVAVAFADVTLKLLKQCDIGAEEICAIGSHGQTIFHQPNKTPSGTIQIGDPNTIAQRTGIDVVADFRRADMARGGQGAPLTPAFNYHALGDNDSGRVILNLGGIANITALGLNTQGLTAQGKTVIGFDTGPANTLLDAWCQISQGNAYDKNGAWARSGNVCDTLLNVLLADEYFQRAPPKSTGPDYFNLDWLEKAYDIAATSSADVQATLTELTATSISAAIKKFASDTRAVFVCGGGAHNDYLIERLRYHLAPTAVRFTNELGIDGDACESIAFAWLAYRHMNGLSGNLPQVTGADEPAILGGLYSGRRLQPDDAQRA